MGKSKQQILEQLYKESNEISRIEKYLKNITRLKLIRDPELGNKGTVN